MKQNKEANKLIDWINDAYFSQRINKQPRRFDGGGKTENILYDIAAEVLPVLPGVASVTSLISQVDNIKDIAKHWMNQSAGEKTVDKEKGRENLKKVKPLEYVQTLRVIKNLENPHSVGLRDGRYFPYSDGSRAFGPGIDVRTNDDGIKLRRRAEKEGIPVSEAHDLAVTLMRDNDRMLMKQLVDSGYTDRPDTISQGVRLMGAQARYNRGNIRPIFDKWARAVVAGDAEAQKEAILEYTPQRAKDRREKVASYDIYENTWNPERKRFMSQNRGQKR